MSHSSVPRHAMLHAMSRHAAPLLAVACHAICSSPQGDAIPTYHLILFVVWLTMCVRLQ